MAEYPQHDKLAQHVHESQAIGVFLDAYLLKRYELYEYVQDEDGLGEMAPARVSVHDMLAEYFGIDPVALDKEKADMCDKFQKWVEANNA